MRFVRAFHRICEALSDADHARLQDDRALVAEALLNLQHLRQRAKIAVAVLGGHVGVRESEGNDG